MKLATINKFRIAYLFVTGAFMYWMFDPTISSLLKYEYAVAFFVGRLGFPEYFLQFTGFTKFVGLLVLLVPGFPKIKEWVYAGFTFDLVGAIYSLLCIGMPLPSIWPQILALVLMIGSYVCFSIMQTYNAEESLWRGLRSFCGKILAR
jgi:hypothetical protein